MVRQMKSMPLGAWSLPVLLARLVCASGSLTWIASAREDALHTEQCLTSGAHCLDSTSLLQHEARRVSDADAGNLRNSRHFLLQQQPHLATDGGQGVALGEFAAESASRAAEASNPQDRAADAAWAAAAHRWLGRATPVGVAAVLVCLGLVLLGWNVHGNSYEQAARSVYLSINFVLVVNFTIVILDSYDLCATLGMSQADSGRMVGTYMLGLCLGALITWNIVRKHHSELWRKAPRQMIMIGLMFQLVGSLGYCFVSIRATAIARTADFANIPFGVYEAMFSLKSSPGLSFLVMASRFISGMGSGWCQQFYVAAQLHITPVPERAEHSSRWVFSGMLGTGMGPLMAAALQLMDPDRIVTPNFNPVGFAQILVVLGAFAALLLYHPDLTEVGDFMEMSPAAKSVGAGASILHGQQAQSARQPESVEAPGTKQKRTLVIGCLIMAVLRAFGIAAVEVALASLLEDRFHWDRRSTGIVIGLVFLCCIPLRTLHQALGGPVVLWIRLMSVISILGCYFLFDSACAVMHAGLHLSCAGTLVFAAVVLFPTLYLGEAMACGFLHQNVLPEPSLFDGNHAQLWYNFSLGTGRFLGPWMARWCIETRGQDAFAAQQMAVTVVFLVVFEILVQPRVSAQTT